MTSEQHKRLGAALAKLPQGRWEVATSNSFRRISARGRDGRSGVDGGVLHGTVQRSDGHPDLSMSADELEALCDLRNLVAEMVGAEPCKHEIVGAALHPAGGVTGQCIKCAQAFHSDR